MKWLLWSVVVLVAVAGIVALVGWSLPVAHTASATADFARPAAEVFAVVSNVKDYAQWVEGVSRVEMLDSTTGKIRFREHTNTGPLVMEVDEARPPDRFVTRIADPDQPFSGTWTFDITPQGAGSRLTITERGEVYDPIFRFMSRFVFGYTDRMEGYLGSLKKKLG